MNGNTAARRESAGRQAAAREWSLVVAVNDDRVLQRTLLASPAIDVRCQLILKRGFASAGQAYNAGLAEAKNEIVVFAHQDVYLPAPWMRRVAAALDFLGDSSPRWGVCGVFGLTREEPASPRGYCYSTGLQQILGAPFSPPLTAVSLDEVVLIVRRSSGLHFDEELPGFHLYGTDLCMQAAMKNMNNYILSAFCIHNANGIVQMPRSFWSAWLYLRTKWWKYLPLETCCTTVSRSYLPVLRRVAVGYRDSLKGRTAGRRTSEVEALYQHLLEMDPRIAHEPMACGGVAADVTTRCEARR